jgi:hypothetical protein
MLCSVPACDSYSLYLTLGVTSSAALSTTPAAAGCKYEFNHHTCLHTTAIWIAPALCCKLVTSLLASRR